MSHADHVNGIDDLRPMTFDSAGPVPAYMSAETHQRPDHPVRLRTQRRRHSTEPFIARS